MGENEAWQTFCQTGKINDYMKYANIKKNPQTIGLKTDDFKNTSTNH